MKIFAQFIQNKHMYCIYMEMMEVEQKGSGFVSSKTTLLPGHKMNIENTLSVVGQL